MNEELNDPLDWLADVIRWFQEKEIIYVKELHENAKLCDPMKAYLRGRSDEVRRCIDELGDIYEEHGGTADDVKNLPF
jgi:hypothetical protein